MKRTLFVLVSLGILFGLRIAHLKYFQDKEFFSPLTGLKVKGTTEVRFEEPFKDMGKIVQGDSIFVVYKFKNIGMRSFIITALQVPCDCTKPNFPKYAIAPNAEDAIIVRYKSREDIGVQRKTVKVKGNSETEEYNLVLLVEVIKAQ